MERLIIQSNVIYSVGYDAKKGDLEVQFLNGDMYRYLGVPAAVYLDFMNAEPKDPFFDSKVKNVYVFRKLDERGK